MGGNRGCNRCRLRCLDIDHRQSIEQVGEIGPVRRANSADDLGRRDDRGEFCVFDHDGESLGRKARVHRHVSRPALPHREDCHNHADASVERHTDKVARPDRLTTKAESKSIASIAELAVRDRRVRVHHCDLVRALLDPGPNQVQRRHVLIERTIGGSPLGGVTYALVLESHVEIGDHCVGVGHERLENSSNRTPEPLDGGGRNCVELVFQGKNEA